MYSSNQVRQAFEAGTTSHWAVSFESGGSKAPDANLLNFIKSGNGAYSPVQTVQYDQYEVKNLSLVIGPGLDLNIPVYVTTGSSVDVVFFDSHLKTIRSVLVDWAYNRMSLARGRAPTLNNLQDYCLIMHVLHYDKGHNRLDLRDSFLVLPDQTLAFSGDQEFNADTMPVKFNIVGTQ